MRRLPIAKNNRLVEVATALLRSRGVPLDIIKRRRNMKKFILSTLFVMLMAVCSFAQMGPITYSNGVTTETRTLDVSAPMVYCQGEVTGGGQCSGQWVTYYHTGSISTTAKSVKTGKVYSSSANGTGKSLSYAFVIPVSADDPTFEMTETETVYCPAVGETIVDVNIGWTIEYATTMFIQNSVESTGIIFEDWNVNEWCDTVGADFELSVLQDIKTTPSPWGWLASTICFSTTGHQPWSCLSSVGQYVTEQFKTAQVAYACTEHP
jgi:hypothetical protein